MGKRRKRTQRFLDHQKRNKQAAMPAAKVEAAPAPVPAPVIEKKEEIVVAPVEEEIVEKKIESPAWAAPVVEQAIEAKKEEPATKPKRRYRKRQIKAKEE